MSKRNIDRRIFLRAAGVSLALPTLPGVSASPAWGLSREQESSSDEAAGESKDIRRLVAICSPLGLHTPYLFPKATGTDFETTRYLEPLEPLRSKFSVLSGLMHPMVDGGHSAEKSFLTGAAHPGQPSFRNSISVDQYAAERMGHLTRFPYLTLSATNGGISYTRAGVQIPAESRPSRVFDRLFLEGSAEEKADQKRRIQDGQSILDLVAGQAKTLQRSAGREQRQTIDQYLSSVRELEQRLVQAEVWAERPKPEVEVEPPSDIQDRANFTGRMQLLYDLMFLALQTDSTRLITLKGAGGNEVVNLSGVDDGWHNLSHHGKDPEKIEQLAIIELEEMRLFAEFLQKLENVQGGAGTLLDQTAILLGSNLGNASSHNNSNLPIVVAGGRLSHGGHLAFAADQPPPLANVFVSFLQHLQLEAGEFSTGTGTLTGLEPL